MKRILGIFSVMVMILVFPFGGVYADNQDPEELYSQTLDHTPLDQLKAFWDKNKDKPLVKRQYKGDFDKFYKAVKGGYEIYDKVQVVNEPDKKRVKVIIPKFDKENYFLDFTIRPNGKYDNIIISKEGIFYFPYSYADPKRFNSIFTFGISDFNTGYVITNDDYLLQDGNRIIQKSGKWIAIQYDKMKEEYGAILWDIDGHWAKEYIVDGAKKGFINGYSDETFKPDRTISRAEFTKALVEALKLSTFFGDSELVKNGEWYSPYYYVAEKNGFIKPFDYDKKTYDPNQPITRAEMARMIARAFPNESPKGATDLTDIENLPNDLKDAILLAYEKGIIKGYPDHTFRPDGKSTRAEAVVMIVRLLEKKAQ